MKRQVLVIGGGPAGLTAALRLSAKGYAVTLVEEAATLGGRLIVPAAPVRGEGPVPTTETDALPPVILGSHRATLSLLQTLGTAAQVRFPRRLRYEFLFPDRKTAHLRRPPMPAPLHTLLSLATFSGLPLADRRRMLAFLERTWESDPPLSPDLESRTAEDWLTSAGQSVEARRLVWTPLSRFLLGGDPMLVSASLFIHTVRRCFITDRAGSRVALPAAGFSRLLIAPAQDLLARSGVTLRASAPVDHLRFDARRVAAAQPATGPALTADWYIVAVPHHRLTSMLPERALTRFSYFQQVGTLMDAPALTVHLWLAGSAPCPRVVLLADQSFHWLTSRGVPNSTEPRMQISLVAAGNHDLLAQPDETILTLARDHLLRAFPPPASAKILAHRIIRAPRAFLSVRPGTTALRPLQQSPFPNLFLAGGWTDTGLPGTLESAIVSGELCAKAIMDKPA